MCVCVCVNVITLDRAIESFEGTDPRPFKRDPGVRSRGRSRWNFLPGIGATGTFYAERVSHPRLGYLFRNRGQSCSKFCRFCIHSKDEEVESEPQHFARDQNQSRQDILLRAGAPAAADTFPDFRVGVWTRITQNSRFDDC